MVDRDQVEQSVPLRKCLPPKLERVHKSVFHLLLDVDGQRVAVARLEQCGLCRFRAHFAFTSLENGPISPDFPALASSFHSIARPGPTRRQWPSRIAQGCDPPFPAGEKAK